MDYVDVIKGAKKDSDLLYIAVKELIKIRRIMEEDLKLKQIKHNKEQRPSLVR